MWPHLTSGDHNLNKLKPTIPEDASTKITAFLAIWFLKKNILKYFYHPPLVAHPSPGIIF